MKFSKSGKKINWLFCLNPNCKFDEDMHECKLFLSIDFRHANIVKFLTGHSIWSKDAAAGARPEGPQPEARRSRSRLKATAGRALLGMEFAGPTYQPRNQRFLTVLATEMASLQQIV